MTTRGDVIRAYFELCEGVDRAFEMDLIDADGVARIKERLNERAEALLAALKKEETVGAPQ